MTEELELEIVDLGDAKEETKGNKGPVAEADLEHPTHFFKQIAKGIEPYIGRFDQQLSFIYVKDLAKAAISALDAGLRQCYFISDGNSYNRYELGNFVKEILKVKTMKIHLPLGFIKTAALLSQNYYAILNKAPVLNIEKIKELTAINWNCDIDPAKNDLNFQPQFNLKEGLIDTLAWYQRNNWL